MELGEWARQGRPPLTRPRREALVGQVKELDVFPARGLVHEVDGSGDCIRWGIKREIVPIAVDPSLLWASVLFGWYRERMPLPSPIVAHAVGWAPLL